MRRLGAVLGLVGVLGLAAALVATTEPTPTVPVAPSRLDAKAPSSSTTTTAPAPSPRTPPEAACAPYGDPEVAGIVDEPGLVELSGLAASRSRPGVFWAHNDSRGDPELFGITLDGASLGATRLEGALAFDWEDVAVGPGPDGEPWVFVGDIGDNFGIRAGEVTVYALPEPEPGIAAAKVTAVLRSRLPDGPHDAEALFVDVDGTPYLVTKDPVRVYRLGEEAELVAEPSVDAPVTGADVSWDGTVVALRGYETAWLWPRRRSLAETLAAAPCRIHLADEPQGEAIAFAGDGAIVTSSEGRRPEVHRIPRRELSGGSGSA